MVMEGADTQPYGNILISGARTSLLHGIPSDKPIQYGDFVLMDFGCQYNGYMSDMTRTVVVGKATSKQKEVYELEKQMIELSLNEMKAGATLGSIYEASIKPIKDTEYFQYHYPRIGHGIGLFVHEPKSIEPNNKDTLDLNCVTTIEPGLYIPNWGGVRIEDQVLNSSFKFRFKSTSSMLWIGIQPNSSSSMLMHFNVIVIFPSHFSRESTNNVAIF
jgi:Xaa-Pro aminopeptidase